MTTSSVTYSVRAVAIGALLLLSWVPQACTNLDETPSSAITPGNFYRNQAEVLAGAAGGGLEVQKNKRGAYKPHPMSSAQPLRATTGAGQGDTRRLPDG